MLRLGNDVVDLTLPAVQDKHRDQRFVRRIFTEEERLAIGASLQPNMTLWALWAAKEATFKACQKHLGSSLIFAHQAFYAHEHAMCYGPLCCAVHWQTTPDYIHCLAVLDPHQKKLFTTWDQVKVSITRLTDPHDPSIHLTGRELASAHSHESRLTRLHAKQFLIRPMLGQEVEIVRFPLPFKGKKYSPPMLIRQHEALPYELSLSHDGEWAASAIMDYASVAP